MRFGATWVLREIELRVEPQGDGGFWTAGFSSSALFGLGTGVFYKINLEDFISGHHHNSSLLLFEPLSQVHMW